MPTKRTRLDLRDGGGRGTQDLGHLLGNLDGGGLGRLGNERALRRGGRGRGGRLAPKQGEARLLDGRGSNRGHGSLGAERLARKLGLEVGQAGRDAATGPGAAGHMAHEGAGHAQEGQE